MSGVKAERPQSVSACTHLFALGRIEKPMAQKLVIKVLSNLLCGPVYVLEQLI